MEQADSPGHCHDVLVGDFAPEVGRGHRVRGLAAIAACDDQGSEGYVEAKRIVI